MAENITPPPAQTEPATRGPTAMVTWPPRTPVKPLLALLDQAGQTPAMNHGVLKVYNVTQAELDQAVTSYQADPETHILRPARDFMATRFSASCWAFVLNRYKPEVTQLFTALLIEAVADGLDNRAEYIRQLLDFTKAITAASLAAIEQVNQAGDLASIKAVEIDFDALKALDPTVTLTEALAIPD